MARQPWTTTEQIYLEEHYATMTVREIAAVLGRNPHSVKNKAEYMGLKKPRRHKPKPPKPAGSMQTIDQAKEAAIRADERRKIIEAYRQIGNVKKVAKHLHTSQQKVSDTIRAAGLGKAKKQPNSKSICFTCDNAFAHKCAFMRADIDKAEAVLVAMGARYKSRTYSYKYMHGTREVTLLTVLKCPEYYGGGVGSE